MNWIFQSKGIIDRHLPWLANGTQPVRVVHHMLVLMFRMTNATFYQDLDQQIKQGKLSPKLNIKYAEEPLLTGNGIMQSPRINIITKDIELHETFLSFLWCCTYSVYVRYVETIDFPRVNHQNGSITHTISQEKIDGARNLFDYAKYIIVDFIPWDKIKLPNPEKYPASNRNYVEQTNCMYTEAVKFILCHEFTHLKMHADQIHKNTPASHFRVYEWQADNEAINMIRKGIPRGNDPLSVSHAVAIENGIVMGILSMFFFSAKTEGIRHPNIEDRLTNVLNKLDLTNNPYAWGIAYVGLQMWDEQFGLGFVWDDEPISYRDQYFKIVQQIKDRS